MTCANALLLAMAAYLVAISPSRAAAPNPGESGGRRQIPLNLGWRFHKGDVEGGQTAALDDSSWPRVDLPHTWNAQDGQDGGNDYYRGPGWYRRTLHAPNAWQGRRLFLRFGAANTVADVYVNEAHVGQHRGGFAAFCFEITRQVKPEFENRIAVRVDNSHFDDVPPWGADFTFFGGIYRDVALLVTDPICITPLDYASPGVYIAHDVSEERAAITVTTKLSSTLENSVPVVAVVTIEDADEKPVATLNVPAEVPPDGGAPLVHRLAIEKPHRWNGRDDPYLYTVRVQIRQPGRLLDEITQPLGVRSIRFAPDDGFFLNGRRYDLHGVNRHQDRIDKGWAIGPAEHEEDFALIRELGATAVRLAHYQQDPYAYALADRAGLVVWAEIPLIDRIHESDAFRRNARQQLIELIRQNANHPSIVCWGVHNEITAPWRPGPDPTELIRELAALAAAEDPSRPSTCAATVPEDHPANWQTGLVAFNRYHGWYHDLPEDLGPWLDGIRARHPGTPLGMSEYGAGASIHHHQVPVEKPQHNGPFHPEEWQAELHERQWRLLDEREWLWGTFIWNMFDFASDGRSEGDAPGRNDKGLVTYDRKTKKDAFWWYKANWTDAPLVYITSRRFRAREEARTPVKVYSNCERVELFVNDVSQGSREVEDRIARWDAITLAPGTNRIRVVATRAAEAGIAPVEDACEWVLKAPDGE